MSSTALYFFAAAMFVLAAVAWGISGHIIGVAMLALAVVMLTAGVRERRRAG